MIKTEIMTTSVGISESLRAFQELLLLLFWQISKMGELKENPVRAESSFDERSWFVLAMILHNFACFF